MFIYALIDPISNEIRYIGITVNSLKTRLAGHLSSNNKTHTSKWINKLLKNNKQPIIKQIQFFEKISRIELSEAEISGGFVFQYLNEINKNGFIVGKLRGIKDVR